MFNRALDDDGGLEHGTIAGGGAVGHPDHGRIGGDTCIEATLVATELDNNPSPAMSVVTCMSVLQ